MNSQILTQIVLLANHLLDWELGYDRPRLEVYSSYDTSNDSLKFILEIGGKIVHYGNKDPLYYKEEVKAFHDAIRELISLQPAKSPPPHRVE